MVNEEGCAAYYPATAGAFFRHANTVCRGASGGLAVECCFKFDALTLILVLRIEGFSARYIYALRPLFTLLYSPFLRMFFCGVRDSCWLRGAILTAGESLERRVRAM